jgi:hypothetical protein
MLHYTLHTHVSYHMRTITGPFTIHVVSLHPLTFPIGLEQDLHRISPFCGSYWLHSLHPTYITVLPPLP